MSQTPACERLRFLFDAWLARLVIAFALAGLPGCDEDAGSRGAPAASRTNSSSPSAFVTTDRSDGEGPDERPSASTLSDPATPATTASDTASANPLLAQWPKPALAIVLTGEQHGYFEPCGCAESQLGGMSRRADLFRILQQEKEWPVTAFDLGGLIKRNRQQSQLKFQTLLAALRDMNYQATALGPEELRFDPLYLLAQHVTEPDHPDKSLSFLAANVVLLGQSDIGTPIHSKVVTVGSIALGVTAIFGKSLESDLPDQGDRMHITINDPDKVLPSIVEELKACKPDLMLLLAHARLDESKELARRFPQFDLVLSAGGIEDPLSNNPQYVGKTLIATVGQKAKYAGVVGFYPDQTEKRLRFELVALDDQRFRDTPKMHELMRYYQDQLRDLRLAETEAETLAIPPPGNAKYVGAEECGDCHTLAYEQWETTPHSHAYESLIHGREGVTDPISRVYDPECLACHVVGWNPQKVVPYTSGFINEDKTPLLLGVQCENCHGPGSRHIQLADDDNLKAARKEMKVTLETAKKSLCYTCHDLDNSPHFDFDEYWPKVEHPGLD